MTGDFEGVLFSLGLFFIFCFVCFVEAVMAFAC